MLMVRGASSRKINVIGETFCSRAASKSASLDRDIAVGALRTAQDALTRTQASQLASFSLYFRDNQPELGLKLAISADRRAPFGQIISVMDAAKEAKIRMVNAFTKEAGKP